MRLTLPPVFISSPVAILVGDHGFKLTICTPLFPPRRLNMTSQEGGEKFENISCCNDHFEPGGDKGGEPVVMQNPHLA